MYADAHLPKCYSVTLPHGATWTLSAPIPFWFIQLANSGNQDVNVTLNGDSGASFPLEANAVQAFNGRDIDCTTFTIVNGVSGATTASIDVIVSYIQTAPTVS